MDSTIPVATAPPARAVGPATLLALGLVTLAGLYFVVSAALPYYALAVEHAPSARR